MKTKNPVLAEIEKIREECINHVADAWKHLRSVESKINRSKDPSHLIRCLEGKEVDSRLFGVINEYKVTRAVNEYIVNTVLHRLRDVAALEQERQNGNPVIEDDNPPQPPDPFSFLRPSKKVK